MSFERSRFCLHGALLLDLESGAVFGLNASAIEVWRLAIGGASVEEIAARAAARYGIELDRARSDVEAALAMSCEDAGAAVPGADPGVRAAGEVRAFRFEGRVLVHRGVRIAELAADGSSVAVLSDAVDPGVWLGWAMPHLFVLRGRAVLHASSVLRGERVLAFSGASGAGKTTAARAFGRVVSEDLVVLDGSRAVIGAEQRARAWAQARAREVREGARELDARGLDAAAAGDRVELEALWYVDRTRRRGERIELERLDETEAITTQLANAFAELGTRAVWKLAWETALRLAAETPQYRATVPESVAALERATATVLE